MTLRETLDVFDEVAQDWGYVQSEGWEPDLSELEKTYTQKKQDLLDKIEELERQAGLTPVPCKPSVLRRKINW